MKNGAMLRAWKNVISRNDARPILQLVHFDKAGYAVATDSHVLLRIDDANPLKQSFNFSPKLFEVIEDNADGAGVFPNVEQVMPTGYTVELRVPMLTVAGLIPALKGLEKGTLVTITNDEDEPRNLHFETTLGMVEDTRPDFTPTSFDVIVTDAGSVGKSDIEITLNAKYLLNCLSFFKDWSDTHLMTDVTIWYNGTLRPLLFKAEDAEYLITPLRMH